MSDLVAAEDIDRVIAQQARYEMVIGRQFSLVSDRMTWLVISQAFLMSAFVLSSATWDKAGAMQPVLRASQILMPLFGMVVALVIMPSVWAAHSAAWTLKTSRDALEETLPVGLRISLPKNTSWKADYSNWPPVLIPYVVLFVWLTLLVALVGAIV